MIECIISLCVKRRALVLLVSFAISLTALFSLRELSVDAIPDLSDTQVIVKASFLGQPPQIVQDQVTYPLTTALSAVPGAKDVRGFSFYGDSFVYVLFEEGTDNYWARSRVLEQLAQINTQLPAGVSPMLGPDASGVGWVYQYTLVDESGQYDLSDLTSLQNYLFKYKLQTLQGVAEVATVGGMVKQYQIVMDPNKLRAYGLSLKDIKQAVVNANSAIGASVIEMAEAEYMVNVSGYIESISDLESVALLTDDAGNVISLGDISSIRFGPQMRRGIAELNGRGEVVGGTIVMRSGENALATIKRVKKELDSLQASLPKGVEIVEVYDRSNVIESAVDNLQRKLIEEILVVGLICGIFLWHFQSIWVVVISLPLGVIIAIALMKNQGIDANIMSLGGIAIAIGAMVDGAIVMIENLHKHLNNRRGRDHWQCVLEAAHEVGKPLFFSLAVITVSFLPVFALEGPSAKLFSPLAYTKTFAMAVSAGLAITLLPVLMGYLIKGVPTKKNPIDAKLQSLYGQSLSFFLYHPKIMITVLLILGASAIYPARELGEEFMPPLNEGDLMYMPTVEAGISIGKARQILQQTDRIISQHPLVKSVFGKVGRAETATDPAPLTMIETTIQFIPKNEWPEGVVLDDIITQLDRSISLPGLSNAWVMPIRTRIDMLSTGIKTPVGLTISGPDLEVLERLGQSAERILANSTDTNIVYAEKPASGRYLSIDIDRERTARYGLSIKEIQDITKVAVGGMNISSTIEGNERYPINIRYPQSYRESDTALSMLPLIGEDGRRTRLSDVADIYIEDGPAVIKTLASIPTLYVYITPNSSDLNGYIEQATRVLQDELEIPVGYTLSWAGQYEYLTQAKERMKLIIPLTLAIIAVLLFLNFGRLSDVLVTLLMGAFGISGGLWLLWYLDYQLSVAVAVGFIAVAGLVVELSILMLTYLRLGETGTQHEAYDVFVKQIVASAATRVRPVLMTAVTVLASLTMIMHGDGVGGQTMQRIAAPMVGGVLSALIVSLYLLPLIYSLSWRRKRNE